MHAILIHGLYANHEQLRNLKDIGMPTSALDLPGCSKTAYDSENDILAQVEERFKQLLDDEDITEYVLVGFSIGTYVIQHLVHKGIAEPEGMVLLGGGTRLPERFLEHHRELIDKGITFMDNHAAKVAQIINAYRTANKVWPRDIDATCVRACNALTKAFVAKDYAQKNKTLELPVLVIHGTQDKIVPVEYGTRLAESFPEAKYIEINSDHMNLVNKTPTREAIQEFLTNSVR